MPSIADVSLALQQVEDPELGIDLVELGLIYDISVAGDQVKIVYSLTSLGCPAGQWIEDEIRRVVLEMDGVAGVDAELSFAPPWTPELMSDDAKFILGVY
jgi:metal-sulfur cluster biosynthetic enzyme